MSYFNSKEVIISSSIGYLQYRIEVIPVDIGEAVRARILDLCRERNLSINKLCLLSGVTQSTVNNNCQWAQSQRHSYNDKKVM